MPNLMDGVDEQIEATLTVRITLKENLPKPIEEDRVHCDFHVEVFGHSYFLK